MTGDQFSDKAEACEESSVSARKPWHAPQFMLTDVSLTDAQGGAVDDLNSGAS